MEVARRDAARQGYMAKRGLGDLVPDVDVNARHDCTVK